MYAQGVVTHIDGNRATLEVCEEDKENCGSCIVSCDPRSLGKHFYVDLTDEITMGASVRFSVRMPPTYLAIIMLLLFPLVMLVIGILVGKEQFGDDLAAFGMGIGFFAISFGAARLYEILARQRGIYQPTVLSVEAPSSEQNVQETL